MSPKHKSHLKLFLHLTLGLDPELQIAQRRYRLHLYVVL